MLSATADDAALAIHKHPAWTSEECLNASHMYSIGCNFVMLIARASASWLSQLGPQVRPKIRPKTRTGGKVVSGVVVLGNAHMFVSNWELKCWVCIACMRRTKSLANSNAATSCPGHVEIIRKILCAPEHEHVLFVATWGPRFVLVCNRCGAWTTGQPRKLLLPCTGHLTVKMKSDRDKIFAGAHPKSRESLWPCFSLAF